MNEDEFARRLETGDDGGPGDEVRALLADAGVWAEPDPGGADALLAAIRAERDTEPAPVPVAFGAAGGNEAQQSPRRWRILAAAAALVLVAGAAGLAVGRGGSGDGGPDGEEFAIAGTPLAPEATAVATVDPKAAGVAIVLDVRGLAAARPGTYYEAWVAGDGGAVPAGTFHMRGGDGWIYLWSGVDPDDYPVLNVTLEREGSAGSSGDIVLTGAIAG